MSVKNGGSRQCGVSDVAERTCASRETCVGVSGGIKHKGRRSVNRSNRKMKDGRFIEHKIKDLDKHHENQHMLWRCQTNQHGEGVHTGEISFKVGICIFLLRQLCRRLEKHANLSVENKAGDRRSKS